MERQEIWHYNLRSFVCHKGDSLRGGHYVAYWQGWGIWHVVDNELTKEVSALAAREAASEAYLLVYELEGFAGEWYAMESQSLSTTIIDQHTAQHTAQPSL